MTDSGLSRTGESRHLDRDGVEPTGWVGWVVFAGLTMMMIGGFQVITGLIALFDKDYYKVSPNGLLVSVSYTTWGWVHLLFGAIVFAAGAALVVGQMWARVVGVLLAALSVVMNVGFLAANPLWSAIIIAMDVLVIYALTVHGREAKARYGRSRRF